METKMPEALNTGEAAAAILTGNDSPWEAARCEFVCILPVRFALSSEKNPPVQELPTNLPSYMRAVPQRPNLKYTLRVLRDGYVHVYHEPGEKFSFAVRDGVITQNNLCPATPQESQSYYLRLPRDWGRALLAFSDAPGDSFWARYEGNAAARTARMHEIVWEGGNGLSSADTLCGSVSKIEAWVEEFRREPGFVRAPFEYEDAALRKYYDPELGHFKPTQEPDAVIRRWRRTSYWLGTEGGKRSALPKKFRWLQTNNPLVFSSLTEENHAALPSESPWSLTAGQQNDSWSSVSVPFAPRKNTPRGLVVLSDPAGICMECAALYHYTLCAMKDFGEWYAQLYALSQLVDARDWGLGGRARIPDLTSMLGSIDSTMPISQYIKEERDNGLAAIEAPLKSLLDFWLSWLNGTGNFSFSIAHKDYNTRLLSGSDRWDMTFCLCTYEISAHQLGIKKVWREIENNSSLTRLFCKHIQHSLWMNRQDRADDSYLGLPKLFDNFSGLLLINRLIGGVTLLQHMVTILEKKLNIKKEAVSQEVAYAALIKLLASSAGADCSAQQYFLNANVPFLLPLPGSLHQTLHAAIAADAEHILSFADALKGAELATILFQSTLAPLLKTTLLPRILKVFSGKSDSVSNSTKFVMERTLFTISALSLVTATVDKERNQRGGWGFIDIAASAFSTLELAIKSNFSIVNKKYNKIVVAIGVVFKKDYRILRLVIPKALGYAASSLTLIWSIYSAAIDFDRGNFCSGAGNVLMGVGAILTFIPGGGLIGIPLSIMGLILTIRGGMDRTKYRISKSYLGAENSGANSREEIEDTLVTDLVKGFSYKRGNVPPDSLDGQAAPAFYIKRSKQLAIDLATFELAMLHLKIEAKIIRGINGGQKIHVYIIAPMASCSSMLKIKYVYFNDYIVKNSDFATIPVSCMFKEQAPCWFFILPVPPQRKAPISFIRIIADFQYMSQEEWNSRPELQEAAELLLRENTYYNAKYEKDTSCHAFSLTYPNASAEDFRVLRNYQLKAEL